MQLRNPSSCKKCRQLVVIVDQLAGRHARRRLDAESVKNFIRVLDLAADIRQSAILLVLRHVMRVDGHDHAAQAVARQVAHVLLGPQRPLVQIIG